MKSNYKRIGDCIQEVNVRNTALNVNNLLGINIDKFFMPSVANIVGTDMTTYKIVRNGQFACNLMHVGRDKRLPVALLKQADEVIVSPAYNVFEILDKRMLNPEYLMMWFSRKEFDRNAWFYTDADVRGGLNWNEFCNMQLPVPSIPKQKEIVEEYNVLVDRINLNTRLIQKLEETAQAIYKQWFVDFEFPNENGMPYKSNGGEMRGFNKKEDKEIPNGWSLFTLNNCIKKANTGGDAIQKTPIVGYNTGIKCARVGDISQRREPYQWAYSKVAKSDFNNFRLRKNEILITRTATLGLTAFINEDIDAVFNNGLIRAKINEEITAPLFLYAVMNTPEYLRYITEINAGSSTRPNMKIDYLLGYAFICPTLEIQNKYIQILKPIHEYGRHLKKENFNLCVSQNVLFTKMTKQ